jgi:hypothetical protein
MKNLLLALLVVILVLGVVAAAGFTGYRFGYAQGLQTTANGQVPQFRPFDEITPREMPGHGFGIDRGFPRGFGMGRFPMMGFGFFSPLRFLIQLVVLALVLWFVYWLFTRSGWRLTRTTRIVETQPTVTETVVTEEKEN